MKDNVYILETIWVATQNRALKTQQRRPSVELPIINFLNMKYKNL